LRKMPHLNMRIAQLNHFQITSFLPLFEKRPQIFGKTDGISVSANIQQRINLSENRKR
jgi:hypothetical protein